MKFRQLIHEKFWKGIKVKPLYGNDKYVEIYSPATPSDVRNILKDSDFAFKTIRGFVDTKGKWYIWDGNMALHTTMINTLKVTSVWRFEYEQAHKSLSVYSATIRNVSKSDIDQKTMKIFDKLFGKNKEII